MFEEERGRGRGELVSMSVGVYMCVCCVAEHCIIRSFDYCFLAIWMSENSTLVKVKWEVYSVRLEANQSDDLESSNNIFNDKVVAKVERNTFRIAKSYT